jgi:hypothetical protein
MATNNNVRINKMQIGTLLGDNNNFVYMGRDTEAEAKLRAAGRPSTMVKTLCRRCGSIKTHRLNNIRAGYIKTCGCGRKKVINTNQMIADLDRKFDDRAKIQENNPHKCYVLTAEIPDGPAVSTMARGQDELWIKGLIMQDPQEAAAMRYAAYIADGELFGQTKTYFGDGQTKFADNRSVMEVNGVDVDIYEEYDSANHSYNRPSPRDKNIEFGCATNNKGLFRISTALPAIKERNAEAFLAIRQYAVNKIRHNVAHNIVVGFNELPTLIRVSKKNGIEEGVACEDAVKWTKIADIDAILATNC